MEFIGVPWFVLVRELGPGVVLLAVGLIMVRRRRPARAGLVVGGLWSQMGAALLPYAWLAVQAGAGIAGTTMAGFVMTFVQPTVVFAAWLLILAAVFARPRERVREQEPPVTAPVR